MQKLIYAFDVSCAYFFNAFVSGSHFWQNFWAFFNSRASDWVYDLIMASFAIWFILEKDHKRRLIQILVFGGFMVFCHNFFNRYLLQKIFVIKRSCPTDVLPHLFPLSSVIDWTRVKIRSSTCFPADHAHTCCMFVIGMFHFMGWKRGLLAFLLSIPFMIARLTTGAHWLTDVVFGSFLLALFNLTWFFYCLRKYDKQIYSPLPNA